MNDVDKKYFTALCACLATLFLGTFGLLCAARAGAFSDLREALLTRHDYFARSMAQDLQALSESGRLTQPVLQELCRLRETQEGALFSLTLGEADGRTGETAFSSLPAPAAALPPPPPLGETVSVAANSAQGRCLYGVTVLDARGTVLTCAYPLAEFLARWRGYALLLACADVVIGALLGAVLLTVRQNFLLLQRTAQDKQRLIDNFSHELRTPLTAVAGYADYLLRAPLGEDARQEAVMVILEQTRRLQMLADRLLSAAAVRGGAYVPVETPLAPLLARACTALQPKAQARGVHLSWSVERGDGACDAIYCDDALVESMLINLLDNAVKACRSGGEVRLCAQRADGATQLTVRDDGCGMDAQTLSHLGEPFFRADPARSRAEGGAGLGLSLCFEIARAAGGTLHFSSQPGSGTTACATLPDRGHA